MRLVPCVFETGQQFLASYSKDYPHGAIFCRTRAQLSLGEKVLVEVVFPGLPNRAVLRGAVVSVVAGTGAWVELSARDRSVARFVIDAASGDLDGEGLVRHHPRYPARVAVRYRIDELDETSPHRRAELADLGIGGAFVRANHPPRVGTRINLELTAAVAGRQALEIDGRVAWTRPGVGFGVRFDQRGPGSAAPLRPLLRRISETGEMPLWTDTGGRGNKSDLTPLPG